MSYQTTTTTSYGKRVGNAFKGIATGFLMFIGGTALLFWNEGNFVKTKRALQEAEGQVQTLASVSELDPSLNNKLIHASALADTSETLTDPLFGISETAIGIRRSVEYYQWRESEQSETRDKLGGSQETTTTYTYDREWSSRPIDSTTFADPQYQNRNWVWLTVEPTATYAKNVTFGAYTLPDFFIRAIGRAEPATPAPSQEQIAAWTSTILNHPSTPAALKNTATQVDVENTGETPTLVHITENTIYFGRSPAAPSIGDVRVKFERTLPHEVSIIATINGSTFGQYVAKNGKTISRLEDGVVSSDEMFAHAHSENKVLVWILRLLGVILVCGGLRGIFGILEAIAKVIPFLGTIVGAGVGLVCTIFGVAWSLIWIAIAWVTFRPLVGIPMLVAAVALVFWLKTKGKANPPAPAQG